MDSDMVKALTPLVGRRILHGVTTKTVAKESGLPERRAEGALKKLMSRSLCVCKEVRSRNHRTWRVPPRFLVAALAFVRRSASSRLKPP